MLTVQQANSPEVISVGTAETNIEDLLTKEWLLTNERGGYASSTIVGCNTRRYHGLLIGSPNPLANRVVSLANCLEMVVFNEGSPLCSTSQNTGSPHVFNLSTFEFNGKFAPEGYKYLRQFRRDTGVHFAYQSGKLELTKSVYLLRDSDTVAVVYDFAGTGSLPSQKERSSSAPEEGIEFVLRPLIALRDFHALQKSYAPFCSASLGDCLSVRHDVGGSCELFLGCCGAGFRQDPQWWFNFIYRKDKERGQDFAEDLWSPGFFKCRLGSSARLIFWASLAGPVSDGDLTAWKGGEGAAQEDSTVSSLEKRPESELLSEIDIGTVCADLRRHREDIKRRAEHGRRAMAHARGDAKYEMLCLAADQFIASRQTDGRQRTTILAGFPWFADWGRDAFISLPGLLLSTGRFDEAKSVLSTFAAAADDGMIPNRFDDYGNTAYFNSIDASLWFINAAFQYLPVTGDSQTFTQELLPTIRWIIDSFSKGTRFGIHADGDGLITGGNEQTQLTWMDAKYDGVAFTARYGKAVEINALWYNSLCYLATFYVSRDAETSRHYESMSEKVAASFSRLFWNEEAGYLNDCIRPDGSVDASLRPNQIFAVSLAFSPLSAQQARCVVDAVQKHLLTPYGLRTLNIEDDRYRGHYTGPQQERDAAYHRGTVWPYLMGPFVEAYLKANNYSRKSKKKCAEFVEPLLRHLTEEGCLGQVSEIFDGDAPHKPRGCIAQAWSVAELIRACQLIYS